MRVASAKTGLYTYPDVSVVCGKPQFVDGQFDTLLNPVLIIEVLSDSTKDYDRGSNFEMYRTLVALRTTSYWRRTVSMWNTSYASPVQTGCCTSRINFDDSLVLISLDLTIPMAEIYRRVEFS